jgi:hypothetical protein
MRGYRREAALIRIGMLPAPPLPVSRERDTPAGYPSAPALDDEQQRRLGLLLLRPTSSGRLSPVVPQEADIVAAPVAAQRLLLRSGIGARAVSGPVYGTEGLRFES